MSVDWSKPIKLRSGEPCRLIETRPEGWTQWGKPYPTRCIQRLWTEGITSHWFVQESGKSGWPDGMHDVVNVEEDPQ